MRLWPALLVLSPLAAAAAPSAYMHSGGSAAIELRLNGAVVAFASAPLDGMSLTFDAATASITDLDLSLADAIRFPRRFGYDTLQFTLQVIDGAGYVSSGSGSNPYALTSGPLLVTFSGAIVDGLDGPPPANIPLSGTLTTGSVPATVTLAGNTLTASFASTKMVQHGWQALELWVGVTFQGIALPEASEGALLALAGVAAVALRVRVHTGTARG
jgi:hypothetical protein